MKVLYHVMGTFQEWGFTTHCKPSFYRLIAYYIKEKMVDGACVLLPR